MAERLYIRNRRKRERRRKQIRLLFKAALICLGCLFLVWLGGRTVKKLARPEDGEEEYVTLQEAGNLVWLLADTACRQNAPDAAAAQSPADRTSGRSATDGDGVRADGNGAAAAAGAYDGRPEAVLALLNQMDASQGQGFLTYQQARQLLDLMPECPDRLAHQGYRKKDKVRLNDWYAWFDEAKKVYDAQGEINQAVVTVLGVGDCVKNGDGEALSSRQLLSAEGIWTFYAERFAAQEVRCRLVTAVARGEELYAVRALGEESGCTLSNVWIMEAGEKGVSCFFGGCELLLTAVSETAAGNPGREAVADLIFENSLLTRIDWKQEKISGRLLRVTEDGAEVEGHGILPFSEKMKIYRLYGRMEQLGADDLCIGYAFTDFVVQDGVIEAALVSRQERMEDIRVLVKTSGFGSAYHDRLILQADCDCRVTYGPYGAEKEIVLAAGEELDITRDSEYFKEADRIRLEPEILTGHISLLNVERAQGVPAYRGSFELYGTRDGIVAVNEVLLEEYLYSVVPSEMPASYPQEALKSQAVCARTYAYARMRHAGLASLGAHVDDSTAFQVYNNISENVESTRAVKETAGQVLWYGEEPAAVYYYSTSCGYGADAGVWLSGSADQYPYLVAQKIGGEDFFYEQEEPWFHWQYTVEQLDTEVLNAAVLKRYEANPQGVLTRQEDGSYLAQRPPETGRIKEISVTRYGTGGVAEELEITGEKAVLRVRTEYNIRCVLCDKSAQVLRQDGSLTDAASMVPSAFLKIETLKEDGFVVGYILSGGGFGHGVGLSQNGAKRMAASGMDAAEILDFFFRGCRLEDIYVDTV